MKRIYIFIALLLSTLIMSCTSFHQNESPALESPYLGQTPPGLMPKAFAPGIVTTENWEYGGVFTPDLKEFYFIRVAEGNEEQEFVVFQNKNNRWEESVISSRVGQPFIAPDGKTMHLGKRYKERTADGWSEVKTLGAPFKDMPIMRLTASSKGTYQRSAGSEAADARRPDG